jgi:drug/metabolite transporter (DMT)-like permease
VRVTRSALLAVPLIARFGALRTSAYVTVAAVPMLVATGLVADGLGFVRRPEPAEAVTYAYIAVVVTVVAFVCWYRSLGRLGADRAGLFAGCVPVGAILTGLLLDTGTPTLPDLVGAAVVIAGIALGVLGRPGRRPA